MKNTAPILVLLVLCAAPAHAQGSAATVEFNRDMQNVWDSLRPGLQRVIEGEVRAQLNGVNQTNGPVEISVRDYRGMGFDIREAFGLTQLGQDRVGFRVPLQGTWGFDIEATVRVKVRLPFWRPTVDIPIKLKVDRISMEVLATFDVTTDPDRPTLRQVGRPQIDFRVRLRSRQWFWNLLFTALSPIGDRTAHRLLDDALNSAMPSLASLQGYPGPVPGDGAPPLVDSGAPTPFQEIAENVDAKIVAQHMPHGTLHSAYMDTDDLSSWEDAYRNGGSGNVGQLRRFRSGGDAAIWTGHFLAAQAFRYASTGDPVALSNLRAALAGIGKLFEVNGDTGLLARDAAPTQSLIGQDIAGQNYPYGQRRMINGVEWIGRTGRHGITRDQYSGVVYGLSWTYDLVQDPAIRAEVARINGMILDYLIPRDWIITEDRPPLDAGSGARGPVFWLGIPNQKLQFLLDGMRMHPGNQTYVAEFNRTTPIIDFAWLHAWTATFGLDHYYKYNLSYSAYTNYFRLETDPARWQGMNRAYRIIRRYVGHHRNAYFDLLHTEIDPSARTVFYPAARESYRQFLQMEHRTISPPVVDLSNVVWQTFTFTAYSNPSVAAGSIGASVGTTTVQLPSEPLNFRQRKHTNHFQWQRSPFDAATPNDGNPKHEKHGLDVVLPYWLGRHIGAF